MPQAKPQTKQRKITEYGAQLQEKQKIRNSYGLREKQFRRIFTTAAKNKGQTGKMLLGELESRLDNVIFRAGFAVSRPQARQLVSHRHFALNGNRVSIPSISVQKGDVIEPNKKEGLELRKDIQTMSWLKVDPKSFKITVLSAPAEDDLPLEFDTQKVIEFYSR